MSLLRAAITANALTDGDERDAPSILAFLPSDAAVARMAGIERALQRETVEHDAIRLARPRGSVTPQVEPRSIHSPSPPSRLRWQPPTPKGTGPTKRFAER